MMDSLQAPRLADYGGDYAAYEQAYFMYERAYANHCQRMREEPRRRKEREHLANLMNAEAEKTFQEQAVKEGLELARQQQLGRQRMKLWLDAELELLNDEN